MNQGNISESRLNKEMEKYKKKGKKTRVKQLFKEGIRENDMERIL